ncbi:AraC family transcriptional regulator [Streptomyces sp. 4N509B]|uniref:AraC family transcriptional regulator n=1 Tax=Streptomyces sp. 4N509B TaxID=3457413 RepID=UPI003FD51D53
MDEPAPFSAPVDPVDPLDPLDPVGPDHPFDQLLRGVRADGGRMERRELPAPWVLSLPEETSPESLTLYAPLRGEVWFAAGDGRGPVPLRVGDAVVAHGRTARTVTLSGAEGTELLVGTYQVRGAVARRLLGVLPPAFAVPGGEGCAEVLDVVRAQAAACRQTGRQVVLDRLLDWLLVCTLRSWFDDSPETSAETSPETSPGASPGWFRAVGDATIGPALRALHAAPERPWTLAALAREAGVSRSTFAGRFTRLVGEPPLTYLTGWRMALAADLLTGSTATVAAVAHQVGYADAFGFSAAFKRVHGVSPSAYREGERAGERAGDTAGAAPPYCCPA